MTVLALGGSPTALWYATRGTGMVALILLTATVVLGLLVSVRFAGAAWPRLLTAGLHRNVSLLVVAFLAVHIGTAVLDGFAPISWFAAIVPFVSPYRPIWLGLGAVALDLLLAVLITSLVRVRLGYRAWRAVHWAAYACWPIALVHGLGTGTDTRLGWVLAVDAACVAAVLVVLWWRLARGWPAHAGLRMSSAALSVLTPVVLGVWLLAGPLSPHWAARAGTPPALLSGGTAGRTPEQAAVRATQPSGLPAPPFTAALTGDVRESAPNAAGQVTVDLSTRLASTAAGALDISIDGTPDPGGGVTMTSSRVSLGPPGAPTSYQGQIVALQGDQLQARVSGADGTPVLQLDISLRIDGSQIAGRLSATALTDHSSGDSTTGDKGDHAS